MTCRAGIEEAVDALDGDTDLKDGADAEPSLGAPEGHDREAA